MITCDLDRARANDIIEKLRSGLPPRRYASLYSAGLDRFVSNVRRRHLDPELASGKIRFVSGSWGSGKTHLFRLLAEQAFDAGYLVSTVELSRHEAPFNKFELVLAAILRNVASADIEDRDVASPLGELLTVAIEQEQERTGVEVPEAVAALTARLFGDARIDIDVKRVVEAYWATFSSPEADSAVLEERRGFLLQWFTGEANKAQMRRDFNVQKCLSKENARLFLSSVVALTEFLGHRGLIVLFDESEMTHSTMRRADLQQAHNNLLHLINEIGQISGLMLVYAAVPEFFSDPRAGIVRYGALSARIGHPEPRPPTALDKVWNLDEAAITPEHYVEAAGRIRDIFEQAFPEDASNLLDEDDLAERVALVVREHGDFERVSRWRAVITEAVKVLDRSIDGEPLLTPADSYRETKSMLSRLGDD